MVSSLFAFESECGSRSDRHSHRDDRRHSAPDKHCLRLRRSGPVFWAGRGGDPLTLDIQKPELAGLAVYSASEPMLPGRMYGMDELSHDSVCRDNARSTTRALPNDRPCVRQLHVRSSQAFCTLGLDRTQPYTSLKSHPDERVDSLT